MLIKPLGTNFSEILSEIHTLSFKKMHFKISSAKWQPFCLGLNVLNRFVRVEYFTILIGLFFCQSKHIKCTVDSTYFHCEHFFWNTQNFIKWKRAHPWWYSNPRPLDYIPRVPTAKQRECYSCWRHQMETVSALLAICAAKSPVAGESPAQKPVTPSFDVFFDLHPPNKRLS